jgi:hypothetical protein
MDRYHILFLSEKCFLEVFKFSLDFKRAWWTWRISHLIWTSALRYLPSGKEGDGGADTHLQLEFIHSVHSEERGAATRDIHTMRDAAQRRLGRGAAVTSRH